MHALTHKTPDTRHSDNHFVNIYAVYVVYMRFVRAWLFLWFTQRITKTHKHSIAARAPNETDKTTREYICSFFGRHFPKAMATIKPQSFINCPPPTEPTTNGRHNTYAHMRIYLYNKKGYRLRPTDGANEMIMCFMQTFARKLVGRVTNAHGYCLMRVLVVTFSSDVSFCAFRIGQIIRSFRSSIVKTGIHYILMIRYTIQMLHKRIA